MCILHPTMIELTSGPAPCFTIHVLYHAPLLTKLLAAQEHMHSSALAACAGRLSMLVGVHHLGVSSVQLCPELPQATLADCVGGQRLLCGERIVCCEGSSLARTFLSGVVHLLCQGSGLAAVAAASVASWAVQQLALGVAFAIVFLQCAPPEGRH